jgi:hypothetical protein
VNYSIFYIWEWIFIFHILSMSLSRTWTWNWNKKLKKKTVFHSIGNIDSNLRASGMNSVANWVLLLLLLLISCLVDHGYSEQGIVKFSYWKYEVFCGNPRCLHKTISSTCCGSGVGYILLRVSSIDITSL